MATNIYATPSSGVVAIMDNILSRKYSELPLESVIEIASYPKWHLDKAHGIYELAFRALHDPSLLPLAWKCVSSEITIVTHGGPPLGQAGAALLLDNRNPTIEETMVDALNDWSEEQQTDFFFCLFPRHRRLEEVNRLKSEYRFQPKFSLNSAGEFV